VQLLHAEAHQAIAKAKRAKHSDLYRAHHTWQLLNCDLVPCDFEGGLGYVLRETSTEPEPYYPAKADDVVLSPAEMAAALAAGQRLKWGNLKADYHAYQAKHAPRPAAPIVGVNFETVRSWALRQAQAVADRRLPAFDFVLDEHNRRLFELLCYYFAGDREFVVLGEAWGFGPLSLDKGLAVLGGVGVGKTILAQAFRQNPRRPYGLVTAQKVSDKFKEDLLANDGKKSLVSDAQLLYCGAGGQTLCFDDVAREQPHRHQHMGNVVIPLQKVILSRYNAVQAGRLPLWGTHLTSNNPLEPTADSIKAGMPALTDLYDAPAVDRLYEMCNILTLAGPSRRN
jgi:hypothetical protein